MTAIRTLIIEDNEPAQKAILKFLENRNDITVLGICDSVAEGITLIKNTKPDLVLLDIELKDGSGFEILEAIPTIDFKIIFTTAFEQFMINALRIGALDYLLKPVNEDDLNTAIDRMKTEAPAIKEQFQVAKDYLFDNYRKITIKNSDGLHVIAIADIVYCFSDGSYTTIVMKDQSKFMAAKLLKEIGGLLPEATFFRVHHSYIINAEYISLLTIDNKLVLKDNSSTWKVEIPVSQRKKESILHFLGKK